MVQVIQGEEWEELETDAGLLYYHSITRGTVQWTPPDGFVVGGNGVDRVGSGEEDNGVGSGGADDDDAADEWEVLSTDSGHVYYYNRATRSTTWDRPAALERRIGSTAATHATPEGAARVGRNGWVTVPGPDGRQYFYNERSGLTQEQAPVDF